MEMVLLPSSAFGFCAPSALSQTTAVPALLGYHGLLSDGAGNLIDTVPPSNRIVQFRPYNENTG